MGITKFYVGCDKGAKLVGSRKGNIHFYDIFREFLVVTSEEKFREAVPSKINTTRYKYAFDEGKILFSFRNAGYGSWSPWFDVDNAADDVLENIREELKEIRRIK